jgi:hypothetical protein
LASRGYDVTEGPNIRLFSKAEPAGAVSERPLLSQTPYQNTYLDFGETAAKRSFFLAQKSRSKPWLISLSNVRKMELTEFHDRTYF